MLTNLQEQNRVKEWFNQTYTQRGLGYLRPMEAYYVFLEILETQPGKALLDVACGPGQLLRTAESYGLELHGVDLSDVAVAMAQEFLPQADIRQGNAEKLPFESHSFDYLTCIGSLERMIHLEQVLQELKRVVKTEAHLCFMVRNSSRLSWKIVKEFLGIINKKGHQGANTLDTWTRIFEKAGFKIEAVYPDVWPSRRWLHWLSLGGSLFSVNHKKIPKQPKSLQQAYEFIFHLTLA